MSSDPDRPRPSFRFRDKFSHLKDKLKDKIKDKAYRNNVTAFVHQNLTTSNDTTDPQSSRHGFRQHMHHLKDVLKNKTHYESIKTKVKEKIDDKFDLHDNKTYPKGFYDSLFSPETENDVYLQTALICLLVIATLCIIPTIIIIFLPAKKKKVPTTSTNMIFFHVFLCELFYLMYILLAIINVAKDFRLGPLLCDVANYGMYVTIPIMQFALLFLSIERLSKHFDLTMTCAKIFTKPYLIQVILCITWVILIASLVTFMFIRKQFSFNFVKDRISSFAPPLVGDVVSKLASRRHHCSVDGRLSSVFKTLIIILFVILIVKPIVLSLGCNLLTPYCCKKNRKDSEIQDDRRITRLVTIFLLLNFFFSFPFYFTSMFNNIFTRIDSTKDTFTLVLKICFILRITNIIFECLAFYIFERNSWNLLRKVFYYATCKKCPVFNSKPDDDRMYSTDPVVQDFMDSTRLTSDADQDEEEKIRKKKKKKRLVKKKIQRTTESEADDVQDDDGAFRKKSKKKIERDADQDDEEEKLIVKRNPSLVKKATLSDEDEEEEEKQNTTTQRRSQTKKVQSDNDEEEEENESKHYSTIEKKVQIKQEESDNDDDEENEPKAVPTKKRKSRIEKPASGDDDDDADEEEEEERKIITTTKRKSRPKQPISNEEEVHKTTKRKSRPKVEVEEEIIDKPKAKSRRSDAEIRIPNGKPVSHQRSSATIVPKTKRHSNSSQRRSSQASPNESENDAGSHASSKIIKRSVSPKPIKKQTITRPSSGEQKRSRTASPNDQRSHHSRPQPERSRSTRPTTKTTTSTKPHHTTKHSHNTSTKARKKSPSTQTKKSSKKDRRTRILEMSHDV